MTELEDYSCRKCHVSMFVPDGMDPLEEDVRFCGSCAIDEIERLREIVARFPKRDYTTLVLRELTGVEG
jgi:hypothetical protein